MQNAPLGAFCNTIDLHEAIIGLENQFWSFWGWPFYTGLIRRSTTTITGRLLITWRSAIFQFYPSYSVGFSHRYWYNKPAIVHFALQGTNPRIFWIMVYFCPWRYVLILANSAGPGKMKHGPAFYLVLCSMQKYRVGFPVYKGLKSPTPICLPVLTWYPSGTLPSSRNVRSWASIPWLSSRPRVSHNRNFKGLAEDFVRTWYIRYCM